MLNAAQNRRVPLRGERGQSIVEFAFVLPFMLLLLFGIVEFGIAVNNASDLNQVAANTARKLSVNADPSLDPTEYAKSIAEDAIAANPTFVVNVSFPNGTTPGPNAAVCVKITMDKTLEVIPGFSSVGPTLNLSGKAANKLEMPAVFGGGTSGTGACA